MSWGQVEVFRGRMFVTLGMQTTGVYVPGDLSDARLGEAILEFCARPAAHRGDGGASWRAFCVEVVGVPVRRYRPEKHARFFLRDDTWQAAWSVDPTTLDVVESSPRPGLLGRFGGTG